MGTVKEICWSTKFRKQQKLANKAKTRDDPSYRSKDLDLNQDLEDTEPRNQSKIPRRIRMSKAIKHKFKIESDEQPPQNGSRTELKRGSELSQVSVILTARQNSNQEVRYSKEVKESHCSKDCVNSKCTICCTKKVEVKQEKCCPKKTQDLKQEKCCTKGKCKDKEKEKKPDVCCDRKRKPVKCKRAKANCSVSAINQSVKANCCACCGVLLDYFNEVIRLLSCKCDTRVNEVFCELCDVASCLCGDCLTLLKKLVCCLGSGICNLKQKKKRWI